MKMTIEQLRKQMNDEMDAAIHEGIRRGCGDLPPAVHEYVFNECRRRALEAMGPETQLFRMDTSGPVC